MCKPQPGGHPSKYWPSAKLLDLGNHLGLDIYYTPNASHFLNKLHALITMTPEVLMQNSRRLNTALPLAWPRDKATFYKISALLIKKICWIEKVGGCRVALSYVVKWTLYVIQ